MEILKGRGVHDYGILRAWGGGVTHFGISEGKGGVKTWKPSVVGYGYFLELPIPPSYHNEHQLNKLSSIQVCIGNHTVLSSIWN